MGRIVELPPLDEEGLPVKPEGDNAPNKQPPEMEELTASTFYDKIGKGYWFIKHYSPRCPHCRAMAPHWQALHDIYMSSTPKLSNTSPNADPASQASSASFTELYNFRIAALNCDAYGDICSELGIDAYPTLNLFKDGKILEAYPSGTRRDVQSLSDWVEERLAKLKPVSGKKETAVDKEKEKEKEREKEKTDPKNEEPKAKPTTTTSPPTPTETPNPDGTSYQFTRESFMKLVDGTKDPWMVKFYAPWCGHCQAMAPAWVGLARQMQGKLRIGEVNCEEEKRLCKDVRLRGYPTILFFQGGEKVEYDGLRGLGDLVSWANKAAESSKIKELDINMLDDILEKEEVFFVYVYNEATTSEDFEALDRLSLPLIGHAPIYKTSSKSIAERFKVGDFPISTYPRIFVVRDGVPSYYTAFSPKELRDHQKILSWMKSVWLPMVPELTGSNSHEIMNGKLVVLGILSPERKAEFARAKKELKEAAMQWMELRSHAERAERQTLRDQKELKIEEAEDRGDDRALQQAKNIVVKTKPKREVGFAWVDGVFWNRWVRTVYGVDVMQDGERVVINYEDSKVVWETNLKGEKIPFTRSEIVETLQAVYTGEGKIKSRRTSTGLERWVLDLWGLGEGRPVLTWCALIALMVTVAMWVRGRMRRGRLGVHHHHHHNHHRYDGGEKGWLGGGSGGPAAGGKFD
ncbi:thioredoxin-like protein [Kalaharituber pfeilii]|nr:thioredoxin-like protein [Kalaharituber pfeilii]